MGTGFWSFDQAQFSQEFIHFLRYGLLGCLVAGVVLAVFVAMSSGSGLRLFEDSWDGQKPILLALSVVALPASVVWMPTGWNLFALTFALGLFCALTSAPPFLRFRDMGLSVAGLILSVVLLAEVVMGNDLRSETFILFAALATIGFVLSGAGMLSRTSVGLAILGGVDVLLYIQSPFGVYYVMPSASESLVGLIAAIIMGAMAGLRPAFTISLGVASVTAIGVMLQIFLWFEKENYASSPLDPDWKFVIALVGVAVGYIIMGLPMAMAQRLGRSS